MLQNWILSAKTLNGDAFRISPRKIYTNVTFPPNGPPIEEDLSVDPSEKGRYRADAYATCSHSGPVAKFSEPGTVFPPIRRGCLGPETYFKRIRLANILVNHMFDEKA